MCVAYTPRLLLMRPSAHLVACVSLVCGSLPLPAVSFPIGPSGGGLSLHGLGVGASAQVVKVPPHPSFSHMLVAHFHTQSFIRPRFVCP